jgi:hypothetical protein
MDGPRHESSISLKPRPDAADGVGKQPGTRGPMRRLTSLFTHNPAPIRTPVIPPREGIVETICAPKPLPRRCLNEGGHKLSR